MDTIAIDLTSSAVSRNPSTGVLIKTYPFLKPQEIESTLAANSKAFKVWRDTPMAGRVACYRRLAAMLRSRSDALAMLATSEMGKTLKSSHAEVEKCAMALEWFAEHGPAILAVEPSRRREPTASTSPSCPLGRCSLSCPGTSRSGR